MGQIGHIPDGAGELNLWGLYCESCGYEYDIELLDQHLTYTRSGEGYDYTEHGRYYWFEGYLTCPHCGHEQDYSDSSA